MQIIHFPKSIYKAYDYAQEHCIFSEFRERYGKPISEWKKLRKKYKMSSEDLSKQFGFSRATYYRKRRILRDLEEGKVQSRSKPRRPQLRKWGEAEVALVLKNSLRKSNLRKVQNFSYFASRLQLSDE